MDLFPLKTGAILGNRIAVIVAEIVVAAIIVVISGVVVIVIEIAVVTVVIVILSSVVALGTSNPNPPTFWPTTGISREFSRQFA